jgi:hypothetical protein
MLSVALVTDVSSSGRLLNQDYDTGDDVDSYLEGTNALERVQKMRARAEIRTYRMYVSSFYHKTIEILHKYLVDVFSLLFLTEEIDLPPPRRNS